MMNKENNSLTELIQPGIHIQKELEAARPGLLQTEIAAELGIRPVVLNDLYKGRRNMIPRIAIIFEKVLEKPAAYWMSFKINYDIEKARILERTITNVKNIEIRKEINKYVPLLYLKKLGYLTGNHVEDILNVKKIYSINNTDELISLYNEYEFEKYTKSKNVKISKKDLLAWTTLTKHIASNQTANKFKIKDLKLLYKALNKTFFHNLKTKENVNNLLKEYGIKLVMIKTPDETPVKGFSFWSGENPAIALPLKQSGIDNFAFSLMYGLAHIEKHIWKNKDMSFLEIEGITKNDDYEKAAYSYAREILVPELLWNDVIKNYKQYHYAEILQLCEKHEINKAILFDRIDKEIKNHLYNTKVDKKIT